MSFTEAVRVCFQKYFDFSGRGSLSEYWWFTLFVVGGSAATTILDGFLFGFDADLTDVARKPFGSLFTLATLIPSVSATVRRLHDMGMSAWATLWSAIPLAGVLAIGGLYLADETVFHGPDGSMSLGMLLVVLSVFVVSLLTLALAIWWLTRPSEPGPNAYGPVPA